MLNFDLSEEPLSKMPCVQLDDDLGAMWHNRDPDDFNLPTGEQEDQGIKTPTAAPSLSPGLGLAESAVTIIDGGM